MSRHDLEGRASDIAITAGWDNAMRSFFAEVDRTLPNGDRETVEIIGNEPGEIETPTALSAELESYATLDEATLLALAEDRDFETKATHPVNPDQYVMPLDQPDVEKESTVAVPQSAIESAIHHDNMEAAKPPPQSTLERLRDFMGVQAANILNDGVGIAGQAIRGIRNGWENITNHGRDAYSMHDVGAPGIHGAAGGIHGDTPETAGAAPSVPEQPNYWGEEPHSLDERMSVAEAYSHAKNAPGIRAEMDKSEAHHPYGFADAPDLTARGSVYGASDVGAPMSPADRASRYGYEPELPEHSQEQAIEPQGPDR